MDFDFAPPPTLGAVQPGDLYVDQATQTLWLGVSPAVDPAQALLVADLPHIVQAINELEVQSEAYTDAAILTRAPTVHTHVAASITDFNAAVDARIAASPAAGVVSGMIAMYAGSLANIGVGPWAGWHLCDGTSGTPDLRDKFVIGAGNKAVGALNSTNAAQTNNAGAHVHTVASTVLTLAQIPNHSHTVSGTFSGSGSGSTSTDPGHSHAATDGGGAHIGASGSGSYAAGGAAAPNTGVAGAHAHSVSVSVSGTISGTAAAAGSSGGHTHGMDSQGDHNHTIPSVTLREAIPFYAIAFIMKL